LAGCSQTPRVVVGSKNFTEQIILGEIVAQHLERRGMAVDRKLNLGGTLLAHEALVSGAIDLYPEYTGTALTAILKSSTETEAAAAFRRVEAEYRKRWRLRWLPPLGFSNTFAMAVRGEVARAGKLATLSDAARSRNGWRLGVGYEFIQRPDGLAGLLKTYGLKVQGSPITMDLGLLYQALENGRVDMIAANLTDGLLSVMDVTVLSDDKHYFPPYECAVVVRDEELLRRPGLQVALKELSGKIPDSMMRRLNHAVDGKRRPVRDVAAEFLKGAL
jgi:glycine betaine/choline ABC-type transport system substrate-binding protein